MNAPVRPEVLLPRDDERPQAGSVPAAEGVARWVWASRFGPILIEVRDGTAFVNGQRVTPHCDE